jgi:NADH-quinone oxidoreductase subunit L
VGAVWRDAHRPFTAWLAYIRNPELPGQASSPQFKPLHHLRLQQVVLRRALQLPLRPPAFWLGESSGRSATSGIIDRFGPNGSAWVVLQGRIAARLQSGYLYSYALVMLLGLVGAISWVMVH